jgi:hypothetical protein
MEPFLDDMQKIKDALRIRGYKTGWPETIPMFSASVGAAFGVSIIFLLMLWSYTRRYFNSSRMELSGAELLGMFASVVILGLCVWKISAISRLLGGLTTALLATESTLWALDRFEKPFYGLLAGILIVISGGLCVAVFYGTTNAMLRLTPFSGVKLTLLLPPVLILANDLKKRIHPESLPEVMSRPPLWGELMLVGVLLLGATVLTIRSDNASFVPGWEVQFRDLLERVMWVRPRTKEFLIGYPCLIIYFVIKKRGWLLHYREVFRIGASMAFASAANSFCHFHTLLPLTVARVVNGWFLGIAIGFLALVLLDFIGTPIWKRGRALFD